MGRQSRDKRDVYYRCAKENGYRCRAAFKLLQLDATLSLLGGELTVVDLCAAPGGWSQVVRGCGARCLAVDLKEMAPIDGVEMLVGDITAPETIAKILAFGRADLVLCDGAPDIYGLADIDDFAQARLALTALDVAMKILKPGGTFVSKIYRGHASERVFDRLLTTFSSVRCAKPRCSRTASIEAFVVANGFSEPSSSRQISFVACDDSNSLDADASYPLTLFGDYTRKDPVQAPINPTHRAAIDPRTIPESSSSSNLLLPGHHHSWTLPHDFRPDDALPLERDTLPPPATDAASLTLWLRR